MKTSTRHSERPRSPLLWALVEFGRLSDAWLAAPNTYGWSRAQILRGTVRAATAFNHASEGRNKKLYLERVKLAIDDCEIGFLLLEEKLSAAVVREAIRRIDQIRAALDELATIDVDKWPDVALPALDTTDRDDKGIWLTLRRIAETVIALVPPTPKKDRRPPQRPPTESEGDDTKRAA